MTMSTFGKDLIKSANEALAIARGEAEPARSVVVRDVDIAAMRKRLGLTQQEFASRFGLNVGILRDWEQKRRNPDKAARTLLAVIDREPDAVRRALEMA
jgi:putative transcriptional regulator